MSRQIAILVEDEYEDLELWYPLLRLREAGRSPLLVGPKAQTAYIGKHGMEVVSERTAEHTISGDLAGIIVPGGYAPDRMRRTPAMVQLVKGVYEAEGMVAAICHGGWMLASANIIKGKKVTCAPSIRDDMVNAGGIYLDEEVVVDGQIVTSRRPMDLPAFMREVLRRLGK
jgi:protease I